MHIIIVEDEPIILERLERQTMEILGDKVQKLTTFSDIDDAHEYIEEHTIDLMLLDLNLHGRDGFDLLKSVTSASFHTIIVSANDNQAVKAFEYGVLDFVAKPFTKERLASAMNRFLNIENRRDYGTRFLSINQTKKIVLVEVKTIDYIVAAGHYSELSIGNSIKLHDKPIERLLALLPPNFERIHRSYIANMNYAISLKLEPGSKYSLELKSGKLLPVGRTRVQDIKNKLM